MTERATEPATERLRLPDPPPHLRARLEAGGAIAWSEPLVIPTYEPDEPSPYPMFLEHRVYQGSSGRVYPLPFVERIASEPVARAWEAIHLENRYTRVVVLPELGGRIHIGYDKTTGYDFLYRNSVIKPALVGLTGPWISGGIEFNWPQHHRPATYLPMRARIDDGSSDEVTVWCSDHDPFARMSGAHGIRLRGDSSVVEVVVRLHNRTSERQSFLWWANAAVRVHDEYQSFFPQDVRYVADHARRALTAFPAADRPYYGVDYRAREAAQPGGEEPRADRIDWYRNIPVPTSYMIVDSDESFFGGYDHAAGAGLVHWADRRVSPGKKQWTWGNAPFGHAWDRLLTDADGPYVELMAGVYTDNQPDFSWLLPGEVKTFSQTWYGIPGIGVAHQATREAAVHVDVGPDRVVARAAVTRPVDRALLRVLGADGAVLAESRRDLGPGDVVEVSAVGAGDDVRVILLDGDRELVAWERAIPSDEEPWTATEPPPPAELESVEELYLTGVHLAQYRHPTRSPLPYWREGLRRDPGDARTNLALADRAYRSGAYVRARGHAEAAVRRVTIRNGNPRDAEPFYLLGLILDRQGDAAGARRAFAAAAWDGRWAAAARFEAARLGAAAGEVDLALADVRKLAETGPRDLRVTALLVLMLRRSGRSDEAGAILDRARAESPGDQTLDFLAEGVPPVDGPGAVDLGVELLRCGEAPDGIRILEHAAALPPTPGGNSAPVARYLLALAHERAGRPERAEAERRAARESDRRWAFPAGLDAHDALVAARAADPGDTVAAELLGTLLYDAGRRREAVALWRSAIDGGGSGPVLLRNAAVGAYAIEHDDVRAVALLDRAREEDPEDARLLYERDQLAARLGELPAARIARLEASPTLVGERDDLTVGYADLLTEVGRASEALGLLKGRVFQPWEGGEGRALGAWDRARAALGLVQLDPPASLGEGRPVVTAPVARHPDGRVDYFATSLPDLLLFVREDPED